MPPRFGAVAQLGERCVRNAEVEGSTPFRSTFLQKKPFDENVEGLFGFQGHGLTRPVTHATRRLHDFHNCQGVPPLIRTTSVTRLGPLTARSF